MFKLPRIFCPKCGCEMEKFGPIQNDYEGPPVKTIKVKCDNCSPLGSVWEATVKSDLVVEIKFLRSLFHDHDHR